VSARLGAGNRESVTAMRTLSAHSTGPSLGWRLRQRTSCAKSCMPRASFRSDRSGPGTRRAHHRRSAARRKPRVPPPVHGGIEGECRRVSVVGTANRR